MQPETAKSKVELRVWREEDSPVAFHWMLAGWSKYADDFTPKDIDVWIETKKAAGAVHVGVWRDGRLVGMLTQVPISPILCDGHAVFRPKIDPFTAAAALRLGARYAWRLGYWKVWARVYFDNLPMVALLRRIGAIYEGHVFHQTQRDGKLIDMEQFAILREG